MTAVAATRAEEVPAKASRGTDARYPEIEQMALATGAPVDAVREMYVQEIQSLSSAAKVQQFVRVIATRRVWLKLRAA